MRSPAWQENRDYIKKYIHEEMLNVGDGGWDSREVCCERLEINGLKVWAVQESEQGVLAEANSKGLSKTDVA